MKAHLASEGLMTVFDFKGYYNGIPVDLDDRWYFPSTTPTGKYLHTCLDYGHLNVPAISQDFSNEIAILMMYTLIWIDDGVTKHPLEWNEDQLVNHLIKIFIVCNNYGVLLNPEKFYPFITRLEYVGLTCTEKQHGPTDEYLLKIVKFEKPEKIKQLQEFIGLLQYIGAYIHQFAFFMYFLTILIRDNNRSGQEKLIGQKHQAKHLKY